MPAPLWTAGAPLRRQVQTATRGAAGVGGPARPDRLCGATTVIRFGSHLAESGPGGCAAISTAPPATSRWACRWRCYGASRLLSAPEPVPGPLTTSRDRASIANVIHGAGEAGNAVASALLSRPPASAQPAPAGALRPPRRTHVQRPSASASTARNWNFRSRPRSCEANEGEQKRRYGPTQRSCSIRH